MKGLRYEAISVAGEGAAFLLVPEGGHLSGWVELDLGLEVAASRAAPRLSIDAGEGFDEARSIVLPEPRDGRIAATVRLPPGVRGLRLSLRADPATIHLGAASVRHATRLRLAWKVAEPLVKKFRSDPAHIVSAARAAAKLIRAEGVSGVRRELAGRAARSSAITYDEWVVRYDTLDREGCAALSRRLPLLRRRPLFSVLMPTFESPERWLRRAVESVREQIYPDWELCIADDASKSPHVGRVLRELAEADPRIRLVLRASNGHISQASNSALALARGELVVLLDHDDELPRHALFRLAEELEAHPDAAVIYSDEDRIDERGRRFSPYFKPDFSPDLLLSHNLISHLGAYRRTLVEELGGFREGFEGSQDYDLALRASEKVSPAQIRHIPAVLYHWRAIRGSAARAPAQKSYAVTAARRALQEHLDRNGKGGVIEPGARPGLHRARYPLSKRKPLVSVIVPTRDSLELLRRCVRSLQEKTAYQPLELIVVDNQSNDPQTLAYLAELEQRSAATVLRYSQPFNFSDLNNQAARAARGEILAFVNNDVEAIESGWLDEMVSHALRDDIGAVGARLLYPDGTVQHAGIVLGLGPDGIAGTPHRGFSRSAPGYCNRAVILQNFSAVSAACIVMRRAVFEQAGGFDAEHLPVSYNDVDLCLRLRERGYRILFTPYAELYHKESASRGTDLSPEKRARFLAEVSYMRSRWGALLERDPYFNPNLSLDSDAFLLAAPPRSALPSQPLHPPPEGTAPPGSIEP